MLNTSCSHTGRLAALTVSLLLALPAFRIVAATPVWEGVAEEIVSHLDQVEAHYRAGERDRARQAVIRAYFGVFEDRKMEAAMRMELGAKYTYGVERRFGELRKAVMRSDEADGVHVLAEELRRILRADAQRLDAAGIPLEVFAVKP